MDFVIQRRKPGSHAAGIAVVIALHVLLVLGLMFGMSRAHIQLSLPAAIEWIKPIEEAPLPKPQPLPKASSKLVTQLTPPQLDMPVIDVPSQAENVPAISVADNTSGLSISASSSNANNAQPSNNVGVACPNAQGVRSTLRYPPAARREGLQGDVIARFIVAANGEIRNVQIASSSNRAFNATVMDAVKSFACVGQGQEVSVEVPFTFRLE